jgi:hypothetical protein
MKPPEIDAEFIELVWNDAASLSLGWCSAEDTVLTQQLVVTRGFFVKEDDEHICVASTSDGVHFVGQFQVPKAMLKQRRVLLRKKRKPKGDANANPPSQ